MNLQVGVGPAGHRIWLAGSEADQRPVDEQMRAAVQAERPRVRVGSRQR